MSKIEDLTLTNTLQDGNLLIAWNGGTRSVRVQDAATYFEGKISGNFQPKNTMLTNLAQLGSTGSASQYIVITGVNTVAAISGANLLSNIGGQPLDATLTALAGLTVGAGDYIEATGADTFQTRKLFPTATATEIADIADAVNTSGKFEGQLIWDTTNKRMLRASGSAAGDDWEVVDGSAQVTPA